MWRSILKGLEVVKEGMIWRVGTGENIRIWDDPWLPRGGSTRQPSTCRGQHLLTRVSELIDPDTSTWDAGLVRQTFCEEDAKVILEIPICDQVDDFIAWHFDAKGIFSVRSAYKVHRENIRRRACSEHGQSSSGSDMANEVWKLIWNLPCPARVHNFMWRLCWNSHPLRMNIARKGVDLDTRCVMCQSYFEDGSHLFFNCTKVKKYWRGANMEQVRLSLAALADPREVMLHISHLPLNLKLTTVCFMWSWWKERNARNHKEPEQQVESFCYRITQCVADWVKYYVKPESPKPLCTRKWMPPAPDYLKVNLDGAYSATQRIGGWGCIGRDQEGDTVFAAAGRIDHASEAIQTECCALLWAISAASEIGIGRVVFETDCVILKHALANMSLDNASYGVLVREARYLLRLNFIDYSVEYCPRDCNKPAHELASLGLGSVYGDHMLWLSDYPSSVTRLVAGDLPMP